MTRSGVLRANTPRPVRVRTQGTLLLSVDGDTVEAILDDWLVEDSWWTERPIRRRYWEILTVRGRNLVVFHDLIGDGWYSQRA